MMWTPEDAQRLTELDQKLEDEGLTDDEMNEREALEDKRYDHLWEGVDLAPDWRPDR